MLKPNSLNLIALLQLCLVFPSISNSLEANDARDTLVLSAISDFEAAQDSAKIWYFDKERACLAVDAEKFKKQFATVQTTFAGQSGKYNLSLTSLLETDGESEYKVSINNKLIGSATNPESEVDFNSVNHDFGHTHLKPGDLIAVQFNSATNGKIPEGDSTAYARGRWTKLTLECIDCE